MMIRVHLNRHGEVHNPEGILYGRLPGFGLSEVGRLMAQRVAEHYTGPDFVVRDLVRSPLLRTKETIAPLANAVNIEPLVDERVIEAENQFEGTKVDRHSLMQPQNLQRLYNPLKPSWGEPYVNQVRRMRAAVASVYRRLEDIARSETLDVVDGVIVSHQLPIWVTRLDAEDRPLVHDPRHRECSLASSTTLTFENGSLVDVGYNDIAKDLQQVKGVAGA